VEIRARLKIPQVKGEQMRTSGPEMALARRTVDRLEELVSTLPVTINKKSLFVGGGPENPWASFAVANTTIERSVLAASFDLDPDYEAAARALAAMLTAEWGPAQAAEV
jgi:hypothetical protein